MGHRWAAVMLGLVLWLPVPVLAGDPVTAPWPRPLGPADALPTAALRAVVEDRDGYLWFASDDGLLRFDGHRFSAWRREQGLPDVDVRALHLDAQDQLWLATASQGLLTLSADRREIQSVPGNGAVVLPRIGVMQITSTPDGVVWVGTLDDGLFARQPDGRWQRVPLQLHGAPVRRVTALVTDHQGRLWIGTPAGALRREEHRFIQVPLHDDQHVDVHVLWPDPDGGVWVHTPQGVHRWRDGELHRMPEGTAMPVLRSTAGDLWSAGASGLRLHARGQAPQPVPLRGYAGAVMSTAAVSHALEDRVGGLWWVGRGEGLWHLPARWRQFTLLAAARDGWPGLDGDHVLALAPSHGRRVWIAGDRGRLQRVDTVSGRSDLGVDYRPDHLRAGTVAIAEDRRGQVWVASGNTLSRYLPGSGGRRHWLLGVGGDAGRVDLQACSDGSLWLGRADRIQRRDADGVLQLSAAPHTLGLVPPSHGPQLLCNDDGRLWATDRSGVKRWLPAQERFAVVEGAPRGEVGAIARGEDGHYWIGSLGVLRRYRWDGQQLRKTHSFGPAHGYPRLLARALVVDAAGVAWAGDARGLVRVDPHGGGVRHFGGDEGLPAQGVLPHGLVRTADGRLAAAVSEGGLLLIDPAGVAGPERAPGLVIHAITARRGKAQITLPVGAGPVPLSGADRHVRVAARLLSSGAPSHVQYRFRLQDHEAQWEESDATGLRVFERLPVGLQTLEVQARQGNGRWSPVRRVTLQVVPAWWQAPPARWAAAAAGLGAVWLWGWRFHVRRGRQRRWRWLRARQGHAERASVQRTRFLTTLGTRIRVPMTAVLGWSELLLRSPLPPSQRSRVNSLHHAGEHLLRLMDDALDLASIESGELQLQPAPFVLQRMIEALHALLLPVAQGKALALEWHSTLPASACVIGDARRLRQILLNLLGNALKFTAQGTVRLEAHGGHDGQGIVLRVCDTGPGMTPAQCQRLFQRFEQADGAQTAARYGGSGLGLSISRDLAVAMGGDITVTSVPGQGTCFQVALPLPRGELPTGIVAACALPGPAAAGALRVLVVYPSAVVAEVLLAMLASLGHLPTHFPGADALPPTAADGAGWDVIVVDPALRVDGERVGARLSRRWPGVPRVALTARADAAAQREAIAAGFELFLRLPVSRAALGDGLARCRRSA